MAVAYVTANSANGSSTNPSVNVTVSGTNTLAIVGLQTLGGPAVSNPLIGAGTLTQITGSPVGETYLYRYTAPSAGSQTAQFTLDVSSDWAIGVVILEGVDQATPVGTAVTDSNSEGTSLSAVVSSAVGGMAVDVAFMVAGSLTVGAGQTQRVTQDSFNSGLVSFGMSTEPGAASVTMSWSAAETFGDNALIAVPVNAAAAGGSNANLLAGKLGYPLIGKL